MSGSVSEDAAGSEKKQGDPPASPQLSSILPPPGAIRFDNVEGQTAAGGGAAEAGAGAIVQRWRTEDRIRKASMALRALAFLLSLISFIITATNQHGYGRSFHYFEEYKYLLAMAVISTVYTGLQISRHIHQLTTGKSIFEPRIASLIDFSGDQVMAYFSISSASAAIPMTDRLREGADDIFTDSAAAAISMSFFAFLSLAAAAVISGYKLSTRSYI